MFKKRNRFLICALTVFAAVGLISGCKKDKQVLDTSVQPEKDLLSSSPPESFDVSGYTFEHESIYSYNGALKFLGSNNDPVFGRTDVGLYLNANFAAVNVNFGSKSVLASAELVLNVDNIRFKGDDAALLSFTVFPLDSALSRKRIYNSSVTGIHSPNPLPNSPVAGISVLSGTTVVRIPLDSAYAAQILHDSVAMKDNATFQARYKGFYIAAAPVNGEEGVIYTCQLDGPQSGLFLNYRRNGPADTISTFRFTFSGDEAVRFNTVKHDYTTAHAELKTQLGGDSSPAQYWFVQGLGGTKVHVNFPVKKNNRDSFELAVHRAELVLPVDPLFLTGGYQPPEYLSLLAIGASGQDTVISDQYTTANNARYDGYYNKTSRQYVFNIARHVQGLLNGTVPDRGFHLVVADPEKTATLFRDEHIERVVLGGPLHNSLRPRFTLTYSQISVE